jgi:hypothetical protein
MRTKGENVKFIKNFFVVISRLGSKVKCSRSMREASMRVSPEPVVRQNVARYMKRDFPRLGVSSSVGIAG